MKKSLLLLLFLTFAGASVFVVSPVHAAVSAAELASLLGVASGTMPLPLTANIYQGISSLALASYNTGAVPLSGVGVTVRAAFPIAPTLEVVAPLARVAGTSGAKVILRGGLGLLGPVAAVIGTGMLLKDVYDAVYADPNEYPGLYKTSPSSMDPMWGPRPAGSSPLAVGTRARLANGNVYTLGTFGGSTGTEWDPAPASYFSNGVYRQVSRYDSNHWRFDMYSATLVTPNPPTPTPFSEYEDAITPVGAGTPTLDEIYPTLSPEYDKVLKESLLNGNAISLPTADQIRALNHLQTAYDANQALAQAAGLAHSIADAGAAAAAELLTKANQAAADAAAAHAASVASPADAALAAAALAAAAAANTAAADYKASLAAANAAAIEAAKLDANVKQTEADKAKEDLANPPVAANVPTSAALKSLNLEPLKAINGLLATTYPFNLPSAITTYFAELSSGSGAPVFDLPLPLGQSIHVDLAILDPVAALIRYLVGILITSGILFYIVHFFRGIS